MEPYAAELAILLDAIAREAGRDVSELSLEVEMVARGALAAVYGRGVTEGSARARVEQEIASARERSERPTEPPPPPAAARSDAGLYMYVDKKSKKGSER